jgi:hypothetical protein
MLETATISAIAVGRRTRRDDVRALGPIPTAGAAGNGDEAPTTDRTEPSADADVVGWCPLLEVTDGTVRLHPT